MKIFFCICGLFIKVWNIKCNLNACEKLFDANLDTPGARRVAWNNYKRCSEGRKNVYNINKRL